MSIPEKITIGTRGSQLALWQSNWVADRLREKHAGLEVNLEIIKTSGDKFQEASLAVIGGKGAFTKEIQDALLDKKVDVAVHSLKDLPTATIDGLRVWAHPKRFNPRDAWFGRDNVGYLDLPKGAVVATGALRRGAQTRHRHRGVTIEELRGNVGTRLRKFRDGTMTGMFLAMAGLERLGLTEGITEVLEPDVFLPAPGQGALAIEGRDDDTTAELLRVLDDAECRAQVTAERAFLATLEGGCQVPIAAHATLDGDNLVLDGLVAEPDGSVLLRDTARASQAEAAALGRQLAGDLLERGGKQILDKLRA